MNVLALDPGPEITGFVFWDSETEEVDHSGNPDNETLLESVRSLKKNEIPCDAIAIEWIESFSTANNTLYETCLIIGRFYEIAKQLGIPVYLITRRTVKSVVAGTNKAKDADIRRILIEDFGDIADMKGRQKGALKGVSSHAWSALAIAVTYIQLLKEERLDHATGRSIAKSSRTRDAARETKRGSS